jgi:hypothetical protein
MKLCTFARRNLPVEGMPHAPFLCRPRIAADMQMGLQIGVRSALAARSDIWRVSGTATSDARGS